MLFRSTTWYSLLGPPGLPPRVVGALNGAVRRIIATPDFASGMVARGTDPKASSPEELLALMQQSVRRFGEIVRKAGVQPE